MKINEFWMFSPKIGAIKPRINLDQSSWSKLCRIENASKRRLCSRTERWPSRSPNPIFTVQNEDQWIMNLSKFQVDRPTDEAGSDLWWNLGSEEKNWIFLSNFKNGGSPLSLSFLLPLVAAKNWKKKKKNDSFSSPFI